MLKRWRGRFACVLGGLLLSSCPLVHAEQLLLVGDDFCPYNCEDKGDYQGYMVDLLTEVFSQQGYSVEYRLVPWSRSIQMVAAGDADILIANTLPNSPDPALAYVLGIDSTCFFVRKDFDWHYAGMPSLQSVRLGVIQDYHYDGKGPLDKYIRSSIGDHSKVISAKGAHALKNNFNMLVAGRLDVLLENCNVGNSSIQRQGLTGEVIKAGVLPTYRDNLYVSFAPTNPKSLARLQRLMEGVERLRASHQLQPILQKYAVSDWLTEPAAELQR